MKQAQAQDPSSESVLYFEDIYNIMHDVSLSSKYVSMAAEDSSPKPALLSFSCIRKYVCCFCK